MNIANIFSPITRLTRGTKIFLTCSTISIYGLLLYEFLPEYLFNPSYSIYYFLIPSSVLPIMLLVLPGIINKKLKTRSSGRSGAGQQVIQMISLDGQEQEVIEMSVENSNHVPKPETVEVATTQDDNTAVVSATAINEGDIQNIVDHSIDPMKKEVAKVTENMNDMRGDINNIKASIENLTSSFETTLIDLKSFQAELTNPLNFMRKYFDSIDLKNLPSEEHEENPQRDKTTSENPTQESSVENCSQIDEKRESSDRNALDEKIPTTNPIESYPFAQIFNGNLSLGKLMNTVYLMEEILQKVGPDSVDLLIEQCKLMGLRLEDEHMIYNIINMINQSGMSVRDTLLMLYKFGKLVGINDKESDILYTKLTVNRSKNHNHGITEPEINRGA